MLVSHVTRAKRTLFLAKSPRTLAHLCERTSRFLKCDYRFLLSFHVELSTVNRIAFLSSNLNFNWQSHDKVLSFEIAP